MNVFMFLLYCIIVFILCSSVIVCFLIQPLGCNIIKKVELSWSADWSVHCSEATYTLQAITERYSSVSQSVWQRAFYWYTAAAVATAVVWPDSVTNANANWLPPEPNDEPTWLLMSFSDSEPSRITADAVTVSLIASLRCLLRRTLSAVW